MEEKKVFVITPDFMWVEKNRQGRLCIMSWTTRCSRNIVTPHCVVVKSIDTPHYMHMSCFCELMYHTKLTKRKLIKFKEFYNRYKKEILADKL